MSSTQPPPPEGSGSYGGDPGFSGMPQYPSAPQVPAGGDFQQPQVPQPPSVRTAVRLMWAGAAISLIGIIVSLATMGSLQDQLENRMGSDGSQSVAHGTYVGTIVGMIVGGAIQVLLWLWMAWKTGQGRNWARILSIVFAAINVLGSLSVLSGAGNVGNTIVQLASLVVGIVAVVLLFRKESSAYFNPNRRPVG